MTERELNLAAMGERLTCLERENRRLKLGAMLFVVGISALAVMGQAPAPAPSPPRTIEAESFIVRDRSGQPRAALSVGTEDRPGLALADTRGKIRAWLSLGTEGAPELRLYDRDEAVRAQLRLDTGGSPRFELNDRVGKARVRADISPDGSSGFVLLDRADRVRASLSVDAGEFAEMRVGDAEARATVSMSARSFGRPLLVVTGRDKQVIWKAP